MKNKITLSFIIALLVISCKNSTDKNDITKVDDCQQLKIKSQIEAVIRQTKDCNKRKDIDCFMSSF
ncbi:MAG: hypothetical protein ABJA79_07340, partial [Parafilimonas sp.]